MAGNTKTKLKKQLNEIKSDLIEAEENLLTDSGHYLDTKYYPLNLILSGDLFRGLPLGQVIMFGGKPQSGKSYTAELVAKQVHDEYDSKISWFDAENAFGSGTQSEFDIIDKGFDPSKFELMKPKVESEVWTIESFGVRCDELLDEIAKDKVKNPDKINLIVLDSLNSIPINKEMKDVAKVDAGQDMGQKSKIIQRVFKPLIQKAYRTKTIIIIINQVYEVPSLYPGQLPKFSGGNFTQFMASRMIMFMTYDNKNEDKTQKNRKFASNRLCLLAVKNRSIVKGTFINATLSYANGLHRFSDICSIIPKIYEPLTDGNTKYLFKEWKLYNEDEQRVKLINQLCDNEISTMYEFVKYKKIESLDFDGKIVNYYAVSSEHEETINKNKKLKLIDGDDVEVKQLCKKSGNDKYKKISEHPNFNIIRFSDEEVERLNDCKLEHSIEFTDDTYSEEDKFETLNYHYFKIKSSKTKTKLHKNLKTVLETTTKVEEKALNLDDIDTDFIKTERYKELQEDGYVIVRFGSVELKADKEIYKKNGTLHFTMALLEKLNPYFNDALHYKNDNSDFELADEGDDNFFDEVF